jgi:hypothetical protein
MPRNAKEEPRRVILDELTFTVKIPAEMDREVVQKIHDRINGDKENFQRQVGRYLQSQLTYGICGKGEVVVEPPNHPRTL